MHKLMLQGNQKLARLYFLNRAAQTLNADSVTFN